MEGEEGTKLGCSTAMFSGVRWLDLPIWGGIDPLTLLISHIKTADQLMVRN